MTQSQNARVFDDENDRWIEVREGETSRDALLRARRDGAESVLPPQGVRRSIDQAPRFNPRLAALKVISVSALGVGIVLWLLATLSPYSPDTTFDAVLNASVASTSGGFLVLVGAIAGFLYLAVSAIVDELRAPRQ